MSEPRVGNHLKQFLRALSSIFAVVAGLSFFVGGRIIHEVAGVDRLFAEIAGIAIALVCLIGIVIAKHVADDIEWREANEKAAMSDTNSKS